MCGACPIPHQLFLSKRVCRLVLWSHSGMLGQLRSRGNVALPGFGRGKGPGGWWDCLFLGGGGGFGVTGEGCSCLEMCPVSSASEPLWTLGLWQSWRGKSSYVPSPGHLWRCTLAMGYKVPSILHVAS